MIGQFIVPVLIGNMIGGTALFALIAYAAGDERDLITTQLKSHLNLKKCR